MTIRQASTILFPCYDIIIRCSHFDFWFHYYRNVVDVLNRTSPWMNPGSSWRTSSNPLDGYSHCSNECVDRRVYVAVRVRSTRRTHPLPYRQSCPSLRARTGAARRTGPGGTFAGNSTHCIHPIRLLQEGIDRAVRALLLQRTCQCLLWTGHEYNLC